jgi:hypothetical protein
MKRTILIVSCLAWIQAVALAQEAKPARFKWHDTYAAAKKEAETTGKPIFLEFRCAP